MKRWIPIGVILLLVILAAGLCATAWNPELFTGDWYSAGSGERFSFREGLVTCDGHNLLDGTDEAMCGAYCFDRNSVMVFARGVEGLDVPRRLYLVRSGSGDRLCEAKDGSGVTYFCREKPAASG